MNKCHRVIWSQVRNCFVVASETSKTKGKPSTTRTAVAAAVAALFLAPGLSTAASVTTALTTPQTYTDEDVTISSAGSIVISGIASTVAVVVNPATTYANTFTNNGTISIDYSGASYASLYGIRINGDIASAGKLTNAGNINVDIHASGTSGYGYGVYVNGAMAGKLTNTGSINVNVVGDTTAYAYGVYVGSDLSGTLTNSGTISATANATTSYAYAYGVYVGSDLSGTLTNSGTISATATVQTNSTAYAYGVYVGSDLSGTLTNTGTISATAVNTTYRASAYGVYVGSDLSGTLTNSGTISATATVQTNTTAYAYGVYVGSDLSGTLTNSGTINATAITNDPSGQQAIAYGIYVNNSITSTGAITNSGTISATAKSFGSTSYGTGTAYGIYVSGNVDGSITNSGTISALVDTVAGGSSLYGYAYGIYMNSDLSATGSLTNSGTISAEAHAYGTSYPYAYGVYVSGNLDGTLTNTNTGTITATAVGEPGGSEAHAYGVYVGSDLTGTLTNSGSITASANAATGQATAYGVYISNNMSGTLTNSGTITVTAQGSNFGSAVGVYVSGNLDGTLNNSGTISATGVIPSGNVYSVYANGGSGTIENLAGGLLDGQLFAGGTINVNNAGTIITRLGGSFVGGNYTQSATGKFNLSAVDTGNYGSLTVGGTATLAAGTGLLVTADPAHTLVAADVLANVISGGSFSMSTVNVQDNVMALNFVASNNGSGLDLTAAATSLTSVTAALPGANASLGAVLDGLLPNAATLPAELSDFLYSLGNASTEQEVRDKVAQVLPLISGGTTQATLGALNGINKVVQGRQETVRGGSSGDPFIDKHFWFKPFGSWANQDNNNGVSGYDARTYGAVFGADGEIKDVNRVGVAFAYARTDIDGNSSAAPQSADINSYQLVLYGSRALSDSTDIDVQFGVGRHNNEGDRSIVGVGTARADYNSWSAHVGAGLSHTIQWADKTTFTPSVHADYIWMRDDGYSETGAGALNLSVGKNRTEALVFAVDGKLSHDMTEKATVNANLGVGYDIINDRASLTSVFAGAPTAGFATQGIDPSAWLVRGGLDIVGKVSETVELTARYDFEVKDNFDNQTASLKVQWSF